MADGFEIHFGWSKNVTFNNSICFSPTRVIKFWMFDIDIYFYIYPVYKALKLELQSFYK